MINHLWFEFKKQFLSSFLWLFVSGLLLLAFLTFYPAFSDQSNQLRALLENFPQEMLVAMGIEVEAFLSFGGYFSYLYTYIILIVCIYSMNIGLSLITLESRFESIDFLYVKPLSRFKIVTNKLFVGLFYVLFFNGLLLFLIVFFMRYFNIANLRTVFNLWLSGLYLSLFFYSLGFLLGSLGLKIKKTLALASGGVFFLFFLLMLARLIDSQWLLNLTPFGYLDFNKILTEGISLRLHGGILIVIMLMLVISYLIQLRRDLT